MTVEPAAARALLPVDGLVAAHFYTDAGVGHAVDVSGNDFHAIPDATDPWEWHHRSAHFDGSSTYGTIAYDASNDPTEAITLAALVYPEVLVGSHTILRRSVAATGMKWLARHTSGTYRFALGIGGAIKVAEYASSRYREPFLIVGTYDGQALRIYEGTQDDLVLKAETAATGAIEADTSAWFVGRSPSTSMAEWWDGNILFTGIWSTALSASERRALWEYLTPTMWPFQKSAAFTWPGKIRSFYAVSSGTVLMGSDGGGRIFRSTTRGLNWSERHSEDVQVGGFAESSVTGTLLAAKGETIARVLRSTDDGVSWEMTQDLTGEVSILQAIALDDGTFLVGTRPNAKIYRSTDDGLTFSDMGQLGTEETEVFALLDLGAGHVLAGTRGTASVYKSTDYGQTWSLAQALGSEEYCLWLERLDNGVILAGTQKGGGIYRSTDDGATFASVSVSSNISAVDCIRDLGGGEVVAFGNSITTGKYHVSKSWDYGQTWHFSQGFPGMVGCHAGVYLGGDLVLAGTQNDAEVWRSVTRGGY